MGLDWFYFSRFPDWICNFHFLAANKKHLKAWASNAFCVYRTLEEGEWNWLAVPLPFLRLVVASSK